MSGKTKVCIVSAATVGLDNRLKKTIRFLKELDVDITIVTFPNNGIENPELWPCSFELNYCKNLVQASNNKNWILRVLWNILIVHSSERVSKFFLPGTGLGKRAAQLDADLYYFIGIESVPEALYVLKKAKKPVIFDSYEYFPKLLSKRIYFKGLFKSKYYKYCEKKLVTNPLVSLIVVNTAIARGYQNEYGCRLPAVIHNCAPEKVDTVEDHIGTTFYFQSYLRPTYNIESLIDAFSEVKGNARLVIQGDFLYSDFEKKLIKHIASSKRAKDITLLPGCAYEDVVKTAAQYDVGVDSISANCLGVFNESLYYASPNKIYSYASAGLCLALPNYPNNRDLVEEFRCGVLFDPDNLEDFSQTLQRLVDSPDLVREMRVSALMLADKYSISNESIHFKEVFQMAIQKGMQ